MEFADFGQNSLTEEFSGKNSLYFSLFSGKTGTLFAYCLSLIAVSPGDLNSDRGV
jgi:hypothetical protein